MHKFDRITTKLKVTTKKQNQINNDLFTIGIHNIREVSHKKRLYNTFLIKYNYHAPTANIL